MTSRRSSGSSRAESAVEPARSQNSTVTCRRSAEPASRSEADCGTDGPMVGEGLGAGIAAAPEANGARSAAAAASSLRRCPTAATPISFRSSAVRSGSTEVSTRLSRNAASYWPRPRPCSQAPTSVTGRPSAARAPSRSRRSAARSPPRPASPPAATNVLPGPLRPSRPSGAPPFEAPARTYAPERRMRQGARPLRRRGRPPAGVGRCRASCR